MTPTPITITLPDGAVLVIGGATAAGQQAEHDRIVAELHAVAESRRVVREWREGWEAIKEQGAAWLDATPPTDPLQQIVFLYEHQRRLTAWLGQVGDVVLTIADSAVELLED